MMRKVWSTSMAKKRRRVRQNDNRVGKFCISLILIMFMAVMTVQISKVYQKDQDYKKEEEELRQKLAEEEERQLELKELEEYMNSDEYVEEEATSKLNLLYDNQIIFREKND